MNYSQIAQKITGAVSPFNLILKDIDSIYLNSGWNGSAHDALTANLKEAINNIENQNEQINTYIKAIELIQKYKDNKETINELKLRYESIPATKENKSKRKNILEEIQKLEHNCSELKQKINTFLKSISNVTTKFELVNFEIEKSYKNYVEDLHILLSMLTPSKTTKNNVKNISNIYTKEEIENRLNQIKRVYRGRDAAVNCTIGIMEMAASIGKKLDYDYNRKSFLETGTNSASTGVDCSTFVSWAINQGSKSTFNIMTTAGLINQGKRTKFENAQKGDILVSSNNVVIIIENNPEKQQFIVAEANNKNDGVVMNTKSYASLSGAYQARDLSSIYNQ